MGGFTKEKETMYGLTEEEVRIREEMGLRNIEVKAEGLSVGEMIAENLFTYFNFIFLILGVLLCLVGSFKNLTFLPVIVSNTLIGVFQELKSKRILDKLAIMHSQKVDVIREGERRTVSVRDVVQDDVVLFCSGNQICADAIIVSGEVVVNESLLTGEADEIKKKEGEELLSGSFVVNGRCYARLCKVGASSYISRLTLEAKAMKTEEQSQMMQSLDHLVQMIGVAIVPVAMILFVQSYFFAGESVKNSVVSMVAAIVGMIPEGLYLLASIALAVGARRLAGEKVLLHDMKSIETLARVDVLCVDKTGTITEEKMSVDRIKGVGIYEGREEKVKVLLGRFASVMEEENGTMQAIKASVPVIACEKPTKRIPFTSKIKYSAAFWGDDVSILGAPEILLGESYEYYRTEIETYNKKGYRVLVFGIGREFEPIAFIFLTNPIREHAKETFSYFAEQGVEVKVLSGDHPLTVSHVAQKAGIIGAENYIDARNLKEAQMEDAILRYTVFGRVNPEQKKRFVELLKANGKTVAMTGDGVNDILAMKKADCSVAMASGSDAAVRVSQVVLLESDFSKMPHVVFEGRRVVNNIQRSASLFLVKNIFSILLAAFSMITAIGYPFEPSQITLLGMFTIGLPAFFLAMQPNGEKITGNFIWNVTMNALPTGLTDAILAAILTKIATPEECATVATLVVGMVGILNLYRVCRPMNKRRAVLWSGCILGLVLCVIYLPEFFAITHLSKDGILLFAAFSLMSIPMLQGVTWIIEKVRYKAEV